MISPFVRGFLSAVTGGFVAETFSLVVVVVVFGAVVVVAFVGVDFAANGLAAAGFAADVGVFLAPEVNYSI